ncbi:hypothetical protein C2G38_2200746 [Gigaspora rosea]|uniref:Uncharacterized protein n=1 Tax=Gigaspora rosea TaxID=44941 RepID=A0A397UUM5_9GLOM|nr:hypothetical protein C2G38_2200746 [Gigaspora rosea]
MDHFIAFNEFNISESVEYQSCLIDDNASWIRLNLSRKAQTPNLPTSYEQWTKEDFKSLKTTLQNCFPHIRYFQISNDGVLEKLNLIKKFLKRICGMILLLKVFPQSITSIILPPRKKLSIQLPT